MLGQQWLWSVGRCYNRSAIDSGDGSQFRSNTDVAAQSSTLLTAFLSAIESAIETTNSAALKRAYTAADFTA
jgi:hypothetical protein